MTSASDLHHCELSVVTRTLSATVMSSKSSSDWNVRVKLLSARRCARMRVMSLPPNQIEPPVTGAKPVTAR